MIPRRAYFLILFLFFSSYINADPTNDSANQKVAQNTLEEFVKLPAQGDVQISPDGVHLSIVYKYEDYEAIAIVELKTRKPLHVFRNRGTRRGIGDVYWVSNTRLVYSVTESYAWDKQVRDTGELIGVNIDGSQHELIFGFRAGQKQVGTRLHRREASYGSHEIIDLLPDDDKFILIAFYPWKIAGRSWVHDPDAIPRLYKLHVYNGKKYKAGFLAVPDAYAISDNNGQVRFSTGANEQNESVIYYRNSVEDDWKKFSVKGFEGKHIHPLSFTEDNKQVYLSANVGDGTRALYLFDLESKKIKKLFHDPDIDISLYIKDYLGRRVVAVATELDIPTYHYLDEKDPKAKIHRQLMASFEGYDINITSVTEDRKKIVLFAYSDINPGDYYIFDTEKLRAEYLLTERPWIKLENMQPIEAIQLKARDGLVLNGYLTKPSKTAKNVPLIVMPHGGPHGIRDWWGFDWEAQLLASQGYAVLQVNYRGSGGFGREFLEAGYGLWGAAMQDDITDATKHIIKSGIADPKRVCIYGASYGGYAALMGVVREPDLYQCAIGSMGVYDLPMMFEEGDVASYEQGLAYLKDVLGEDLGDQKVRSPAYNAEKIKAKVLLIHGAQDVRAPIEQAESMKDALDEAGKKYEWLELGDEGHGYYDEKNRLVVYQKILTFLEKSFNES